MNINYIKEPGFIYDLLTMIILVLNKDSYIAELKRRNHCKDEDLLFYENIINQCDKISEDILPFFYIEKNSPCFMSTYYFMFKKNMISHTVNDLLNELSDTELLKNNLTEYYFGAANKNNSNYFELIEDTNLNYNLKYRLTRVFSDIPRSSKMVIDYIKKMIPVLDNIYTGFDEIIKEKVNMLNNEKIINSVFSLLKTDTSNIRENMNISISIINRYIGFISVWNDILLLLLGDGFIDNIDLDKEEDNNINIDLYSFGKIISDPTRFKIYELLKENKEIYTSEICERLNMTITSVSYHLNMMVLEKLLKSRNEGRKVFYSINNDYLLSLSNMVLSYIKN